MDDTNINQNNKDSNNTTINSHNTTIATQAPTYNGVFYAYLKVTSDSPRSTVKKGLKILIFASRDEADRWWRIISGDAGIERVNPQFYRVTDAHHVEEIEAHPNIFMVDAVTAAYGVTTIPTHTIIDRVSGTWFTVRSIAHPSLHWYFDPTLKVGDSEGFVVASEKRRTTFRIDAIGIVPGGVIIDVDVVTLRVSGGNIISLKEVPTTSLPQIPAENGTGTIQNPTGATAAQLLTAVTCPTGQALGQAMEFSFGQLRYLNCQHSGENALVGFFAGNSENVVEEWEFTVY